jgi:hypothetical protein
LCIEFPATARPCLEFPELFSPVQHVLDDDDDDDDDDGDEDEDEEMKGKDKG